MSEKKSNKKEISIDEISLEDALSMLEEILDEMDDEDITLEDSLKKYEFGVKLVKKCRDEIDRAQKRLIELNPETGEEE